jgi:hypothetical protein
MPRPNWFQMNKEVDKYDMLEAYFMWETESNE